MLSPRAAQESSQTRDGVLSKQASHRERNQRRAERRKKAKTLRQNETAEGHGGARGSAPRAASRPPRSQQAGREEEDTGRPRSRTRSRSPPVRRGSAEEGGRGRGRSRSASREPLNRIDGGAPRRQSALRWADGFAARHAQRRQQRRHGDGR